MLDISDAVLRLGSAALIGGAIGLNRDLHGKPTGVRTLGLVALGTAAITFAIVDATAQSSPELNAVSRVMQGILTGIGFLGAGVIIHDESGYPVHGITTATCVWMTACIGMVCGLANWKILAVALPLLFILLIVGEPLERVLHQRWSKQGRTPPDE